MARALSPDRYLDVLIMADFDTAIALPNPLTGGGPLALGAMFTVADNLGRATAHNISISGPIAGGSSGTGLTSNYTRTSFMWMGSTFIQK